MMSVRAAEVRDAAELAPELRHADLREIQAASGEDPLVVLERGIALSEPCYAVLNEAGKPVALFGVVSEPSHVGVGTVWLLGSDELVRSSFSLLRSCRPWVERLQQRYEILWNCVDARNQIHIRWLKWCGFSIVGLVESYGIEQRPFYEFSRARNSVSQSLAGEPLPFLYRLDSSEASYCGS